jgi:hypothetical protein
MTRERTCHLRRFHQSGFVLCEAVSRETDSLERWNSDDSDRKQMRDVPSGCSERATQQHAAVRTHKRDGECEQ